MKTNKELNLNWRGYNLTIPKGTRLTHQTACGIDKNYHFVDDLSFLPEHSIIKHDAIYYGININLEHVEK